MHVHKPTPSKATPRQPTPAQAQTGNYKKRKLQWQGLTVTVENEAGSGQRADGEMIKTLVLVFPSGNRHALSAGAWTWDDGTLAKAAGTPPGARWITVHPNGKNAKGVPVMVQESSSGSGVYHVIGGAGGKLNYLKLRGLKPESSYKEQAAERARARRDEKKAQAARDKKLGLDKGKATARSDVALQQREQQREFVKQVAQAMGWKPEELEPDIPEHLSATVQDRLLKKHHGDLLRRAHQAVELQRQNLLTDVVARQEAGMALGASEAPGGDVAPEGPPHEHDDTQLTMADLDTAKPASAAGLGFSAKYAERAEQQGASAESIQDEAGKARAQRTQTLTDAQRQAIQTRADTQRQVKAEIESLRDPVTADVKATLVDAKQAVELLKAQKKLRAVEKASQKAMQDIDKASEVKAYNLEVSVADDEADIGQDIENDLRTLRTRAFLSTVSKEADEPEKQLRRHVAAGAFNSINALAVTKGGAALLDRSVVDVLGAEGAAQVLARRLHADLPAHEVERLVGEMEDFHLHHYMESSQEAMRQAEELKQAASEIGLGQASHGEDFEVARELNARRMACLEQVHQVLGTALGEMQTNAALITALKGGRGDRPLEVPMGSVTDEDAIRQARAIGLQRGDYKIERVAGAQVLTVTPEGMDRLAQPIDRERLQLQRDTLELLNGAQDEDNWLPMGFARRPDLGLDVQPGAAPSLAKPFEPPASTDQAGLERALRDYIGARTADGDAPADIVADIQSADFFQKAGDSSAYRTALDAVAPMRGEDGKMARVESLADPFNGYADAYMQAAYGGQPLALHRQNFAPDAVAQEALHRALAASPEAVVAYKPIGELTDKDQRALRQYFYKNVARENPQETELRERLEALQTNEPEREVVDMFGEAATNPEWSAWRAQRDVLAEEVHSASLDWQKYASMMRGHTHAYAALQDLIRSGLGEKFQQAYNRLNPSAPLKIGRQVIRGNLNHLDAVDPAAREQRLAQERQLMDSLRERVDGRYASGAVSDKLDAARDGRAAFEQSQMGFFSGEGASPEDMLDGKTPKPEIKPLKADERHTLGHAAERTLAAMMGVVGKNFKPGQPLQIFNPTMSGKDGIMRQRSIKMIEQNKRVALAAGVGSGKTAMMLGAFSHLQSQGKARRGLFLVPSIVQGEFGAEALRFLEPAKYQWHCEPGASREERIAAYKDPSHHFTVMTHQAFRDDMLHLGAQHAGTTPEQLRERLQGMAAQARTEWMRGVMQREGIHYDYSAADEAHGTLNRQGKENSGMANVIDAMTANTEYYVHATADPIKNDLSEAASLMQKMDPQRYGDTAAFMRRYGVNTAAAKDALRREMLPHVLPYKITPPVQAHKQEISVKPSEAQQKSLVELEKHVAAARMARMQGQVDVPAIKAVSPHSFEGVPAEQHEAVARELSQSLGIMKAGAMRKILDAGSDAAKLDALGDLVRARRDKSGVIFAHSLEAVGHIKARLEKDGLRVNTITGSDTADDKARKIRGFRGADGKRDFDIIVASDAGATGANLQTGQWLVQYDTSHTAMTHAQRNGRIHRIGQKNDVELIDLVSDHASERKARERLKTKYALRDLMTSPMHDLDDTGLAAFLHQRKVQKKEAALV